MTSKLGHLIGKAYRSIKDIEAKMADLMKNISSRHIPQEHLEKWVSSNYPAHYKDLFHTKPSWISTLIVQAAEEQADWETVGKTWREASIINFCATGRVLQFLDPPKTVAAKVQNAPDATTRANMFSVFSDRGSLQQPSDCKH